MKNSCTCRRKTKGLFTANDYVKKRYVDGQKWVCNPFFSSHCLSNRSKVPPVNVAVTVTESFDVNRP